MILLHWVVAPKAIQLVSDIFNLFFQSNQLFQKTFACPMLVSIKKKRKLFLVRLAKIPWFAYYVAVSINPLVDW